MDKIKILILEDHAVTRYMLVLALQRLGHHQLYCAEDGEQAFALLQSEGAFDVLICDIQMTGVDGLEFLRHARERGTVEALIIASGIEADLRLAIRQLAQLLGYQVLGDLGKPFTERDLQALLLQYRPIKPQPFQAPSPLHLSRAEVERGLAQDEFVPFYQPKLDLRSLAVAGAEVLVRWQHPQHGLLSPSQFLQSVQCAGGLDAMTASMARQALRFLCHHLGDKALSLSINLEASQLASPGLLAGIRELLKAEGVAAPRLMLEVTETGLMQAPIASIENLVRLRLLGCGISIDDFGAGFSSLQRICEMPCTELKLDASFVNSMTHNSRSLAAVESLLHLARKLGLCLVAEGIETQEQLVLLQELGCPVGQGYFFAPPQPAGAFAAWLQRHYTDEFQWSGRP